MKHELNELERAVRELKGQVERIELDLLFYFALLTIGVVSNFVSVAVGISIIKKGRIAQGVVATAEDAAERSGDLSSLGTKFPP